MPSPYDEFRESIRANWNDEQTVAAWRRWHQKIAKQQALVNEALVEAAGVGAGMRVLDLASGSGEPALHISRVAEPGGEVAATDLSAGMLDLARGNARAQRISNITFAQCDAEDLPFEDESFDAVTSRMGAMFFVDLHRALSEIRRVLRRGRRLAFAVWGPMGRTTLFSALLGPFLRRVEAPTPPPGAPHPFRFAAPGTLTRELRAAAFDDVQETSSVVPTPWPGPPEEAWEMFYEVAGPPYIDELPAKERASAIGEAIRNLRELFDGQTIDAHSAIVIASGRKPV